MQPTEIEKNRFDAASELSQIEMRLSDARVAFENLKKAEEEYLVQRETKVAERLDALSKSLKEGYDAFLGNVDTFEKIKGIISEFSNKAVNLTAEVKEISQMLVEKITTVDAFVDSKMTKLKDDSNRIVEEREKLDKDIENLAERTKTLLRDELALNKAKKEFEEKWSTLN